MCVALTKHPGAFFLVSLHCRRISHLKLVAPNSGTTVMNDNNNKVILTSRREAPADQECRWKGCAQKRDEFQSCFFVFKSNFWFSFFVCSLFLTLFWLFSTVWNISFVLFLLSFFGGRCFRWFSRLHWQFPRRSSWLIKRKDSNKMGKASESVPSRVFPWVKWSPRLRRHTDPAWRM